MTRLRVGLLVVKQRQSSNTVECPQVPFIERSSKILIDRNDRFPSREEFFKSQAQLDIVLFGRRDGSVSSGPNRSDNVSPNNKVSVVEVQWFVLLSDSQLGHREVSKDALVKAEAQFNKEPCWVE